MLTMLSLGKMDVDKANQIIYLNVPKLLLADKLVPAAIGALYFDISFNKIAITPRLR